MPRKPGNPNWGKATEAMHRLGVETTAFEKVVAELGLTPDEMPGSKKLREWVKSHKNSRYVPESLLDAYGMKVDVDSAFGERRLPGF